MSKLNIKEPVMLTPRERSALRTAVNSVSASIKFDTSSDSVRLQADLATALAAIDLYSNVGLNGKKHPSELKGHCSI